MGVLVLSGSARWATLPSLETASEDERIMLAHHPNCPSRLIKRFAQDNDWRVRAVAGGPSGPRPVSRISQRDSPKTNTLCGLRCGLL